MQRLQHACLCHLSALVLCLMAAACGSHQASSSCANVLPAQCPSPAPSYGEQIAAIVAQRCVSCHGPGGQTAYMPLGDYNSLFEQRIEVEQVIEQCVMPPSSAAQPNDAERGAILGWLVCGAPNN